MRKGIAAFTIILLIALIVMATVSISSLLKNGGTSLNEIAGGIRVSKCTDSDGAVGYYTKGTCRGTNGYFTDSCLDLSLIEYYCSGNRCLSKGVSCPSGYTCSDGACVVPCKDECSPSGYVQCTGNQTYRKCGNYDTDTCLEWGPTVSCPSGYACFNGACVKQNTTTTCTDSDGGKNYYAKGSIFACVITCTGTACTQTCTIPMVDYCKDSYSLNEYYCGLNNSISSETYMCPYGYSCSNGACILNQTQGIQVVDLSCAGTSPNSTVSFVIRNIGTQNINNITCKQSAPPGDICTWIQNPVPIQPGNAATFKEICTGTGGRLCVYNLIPSVGSMVANVTAYCA